MVGLEVLQHEQEEVADHHGNDDAMSVHFKLILSHLGELQLLVDFVLLLTRWRRLILSSFAERYIVQQGVCLAEDLRFEAALLEELSVGVKEE